MISQQSIGGKLIVLSASLPTLGAGALKNREDPKILGTSKVCVHFLYSFKVLLLFLLRNRRFFNLPPHSTKPSQLTALVLKFRLTCSCSVQHIRILLH